MSFLDPVINHFAKAAQSGQFPGQKPRHSDPMPLPQGLLGGQPGQQGAQPTGLLNGNFQSWLQGQAQQSMFNRRGQPVIPSTNVYKDGRLSLVPSNMADDERQQAWAKHLSSPNQFIGNLHKFLTGGGNIGGQSPETPSAPMNMAATQPGGGFPNAPFTPMPSGMSYDRGRSQIQRQAKEAMRWLQSRMPQVGG